MTFSRTARRAHPLPWLLAAFFWAWLPGVPAAAIAGAPQHVFLGDANGLDGYLYLPEPGNESRPAKPRPAVVLLHGCGGLFARDGELSPRHRQWGELLAAQGYVALFVDSFSSRGLREICTQTPKTRPLHLADRVGDAWAGRAFLAARAEVDAQRMALLGWSNGGSTVLRALRETPQDTPPFAAAIAFYPGCAGFLRSRQDYRPASPLLLLIGEADDWTPAEPCRQLAAAAPEIHLITYPEAHHAFDTPAGQVRKRLDVPNGVNPGAGVTFGPNPAARADAMRRVTDFLAGQLP